MKIVLLTFALSFVMLAICCGRKNPVLTNRGMFQGIFVVVPTPLKEDQGFDAAGLAHLVDYYIREGCHGILLLGSGGEHPYFTLKEKKEIVKTGMKAARGRVPVMVGAGYCGFGDLEAFIREMSPLKVDALLVALPSYYPVKAADAAAYYAKIGSITKTPVLYYHYPQMTGLKYSPEEMHAIFTLPGIIGVKDSALNLPATRKLMATVPAGKPFSYFTGVGLLLSDTVAMGGAGVIDPLASIAPSLVAGCYEALRKGDRDGAAKLQKKINNLLPMMNSFGLPVSVQKAGFSVMSRFPVSLGGGRNPRHAVTKEILRQLGHPVTATVKSPLPQITEEDKKAVEKFIRDAGLEKYKR